MADRNQEVVKGYALGMQQAKSLNEAVRVLADHVNEHSILLFALIKKLGTTPDELLASLDSNDFVNPADVPAETIKVTDVDRN